MLYLVYSSTSCIICEVEVQMRIILILFYSLLLSACAYKIDVQQGNSIETNKLSQLKTGMNKQQVQFLMGTAMLIDPFQPHKWEYIYSFRKGGQKMKRKRLTLTFKDGVLANIDKSQFKDKIFE